MILKATDCRFVKHQISACACLCAHMGRSQHTHMHRLIYRPVIPAENVLSVVIRQRQQREHQGLFWVQGLSRGRVPLDQVAFSYPLNQHQGFRV